MARAQARNPAAQPDARVAELRAKLTRQLRHISGEFDGVLGMAVKDLTSGEMFEANADTLFPQASSIKLPILIALYQQAQADGLRLRERIEVKRAQMVGGSGVVQHFGDATSALSLGDLAVLMIVLSDNTATNVLIDRLGMDKVNDFLKRQELTETHLQRRMMDLDAQRAGRENLSTPREMVALLEQLYQGKLLDPAHTAAVLEILKYRKSTPLRRGLPENVELADKPGELEGVRCDSGLVLLVGRPYAIAVMTTYVKETESADRAISEISRLAFGYFERLARSNPEGARRP